MGTKEFLAGLAVGGGAGAVATLAAGGRAPGPLYPQLATRVRIEAYYPVEQWQNYELKHITRFKTRQTEIDVWGFFHSVEPWRGDPEAYMNIFWSNDFQRYVIEIMRCGALTQRVLFDGVEKALWEGVKLPDSVGVSQLGYLILHV